MMAIFYKVIRCLSLVLITCQGNAAPLFADSEKIDGMSLTERPPLQVVEACLHSIGYSLSDTCKEHSALYDVPDRNLEEEDFEDEDTSFYIKNGISALICVILAALAAGLTMGLVSQELIDLKIKEAAGDAVEKKQARAVIPLIKDHHRMLVTLLLLNAMANEGKFLSLQYPATVELNCLIHEELIALAAFIHQKFLMFSKHCPYSWTNLFLVMLRLFSVSLLCFFSVRLFLQLFLAALISLRLQASLRH